MSPEHVVEVDRLYDLYDRLPGGCTLPNMLSQLSSYQRERSEAIAETFRQFDSRGNGVLSRDDYFELVKFNYPPFRQSETFVESTPLLVTPKVHPLNKDKRVYFPHIKYAKAPNRQYGSSELMAVRAGSRKAKALQQLQQQCILLHVSPSVKAYADQDRAAEDEPFVDS